MAELVHKELRKHGVKIVLGKKIEGFRPPVNATGAGIDFPKSCWTLAGDHDPIPADLVILGLGVRPEVTLARTAGLAIGERGGIRVNEKLQTSSPNIWAVGDAIEVRNPISDTWTLIALGKPPTGRVELPQKTSSGADRVYDGTLGTAILRVFDLTVGCVGLNEVQLRSSNIPYEPVHVHPSSHASYYPGAERLDMKILFHKETGALLGAQVIGKDGADKRLDVIATAIKARMTIRDLSELELAYAPPYGSAKDAINLAGMAGTNVLDGLTEQVQWHQVEALSAAGTCLIDVRSLSEYDRGHIEGCLHIPLPELRKRLSEIPREKDIVTYCQSGQRSYLAYRMLRQKGFRVKNLSGGYLTWSLMPAAGKCGEAAQSFTATALTR